MRRGTTPTCSFTTEFLASEIADGYITFSQSKQTVLEKQITDENVVVSDNLIELVMTQEDTLSFKQNPLNAQVQIRLRLNNGKAVASNIVTFDVKAILKDGVI